MLSVVGERDGPGDGMHGGEVPPQPVQLTTRHDWINPQGVPEYPLPHGVLEHVAFVTKRDGVFVVGFPSQARVDLSLSGHPYMRGFASGVYPAAYARTLPDEGEITAVLLSRLALAEGGHELRPIRRCTVGSVNSTGGTDPTVMLR